MIVEPELLLLDEPFGALDERTREGMQHLLLKAVRETGCSVIFVTHDVAEAILLADKLVMLSKRPGKVIRHAQLVPQSRNQESSCAAGSLLNSMQRCWISLLTDRCSDLQKLQCGVPGVIRGNFSVRRDYRPLDQIPVAEAIQKLKIRRSIA